MAKIDNTLEFLKNTIDAKNEIIKINDDTINMLQEMVAIQKEMIASSKRIKDLDEQTITLYKDINKVNEKIHHKELGYCFTGGVLVTAGLVLLIKTIMVFIS
jgi:hypothetical protein